VIISPITIEGNGAILHRDSAEAFRFFNIHPDADVTIRNVTLSNGGSTGTGDSYSSVIYTEGILTLENSFVVQSNGYAITVMNYNADYALTVNNTEFTDPVGGRALDLNSSRAIVTSSLLDGFTSSAIYTFGDLSIGDSVFTNNAGSEGGAIRASELSVTGSRFENNIASDAGGAIFGASMTISDTIFAHNELLNGTDGSAIRGYDDDAQTTVSQSCIVGNSHRRDIVALSGYYGNFDASNNWWGTRNRHIVFRQPSTHQLIVLIICVMLYSQKLTLTTSSMLVTIHGGYSP